MIAYALCVMLGKAVLCTALPAKECKDAMRWYLDNGYKAECRIAEQPALHQGRTK